MDTEIKNQTDAEKKEQLFLRQKKLLDMFFDHGAITKQQHDKSLNDLTEKMGFSR